MPGQNSGRRTLAEAYAGSDYPSSWPLPPLDLVHLSYEDSAHYSIDTPYGEAAWNATLPSGGHLVYLGPDRRAFTLAMFHEIRCLNILREVLVAFYADSTATDYDRPAIVKHCMNYLRQMVLCRADVRLESVRASSRSRKTVADVTHECRDWEAVYEAAERNYEEYINLNGRDDTVDTVA